MRGWNFRRLAAAAVVAVLGVTAPSTFDPGMPAAAAPPAKPQCPDEQPGEASALLTAKLCKKKVRIAGLTSATDEVFANPDGTRTLQRQTRPVRAEHNGTWQPIDTTLRFAADGSVAPGLVGADVKFSGGGGGALVTAGKNGTELSLGSPVGQLPKPTLDKDTATYAEVLPGVDLQVTASADGFSEVLVVKNREAAKNPALKKLAFPTTTKGLTAKSGDGKRVDFTDGAGRKVVSTSSAEMWDAASERASSSGSQSQPQSRSGVQAKAAPAAPQAQGKRAVMPVAATGTAIELTPDAAMLADPATEYPVKIDPLFTFGPHGWWYVDSGWPGNPYRNTGEWAPAGTYNGGANKKRSFFNFELSGMGSYRFINQATLKAKEVHAWSCSAREVELHRTYWVPDNTSWNQQPASNWWVDNRNVAYGYSSSCPASWVTWDVTAALQDNQNKGYTAISFMLKAKNETDDFSWKKFDPNLVLEVNFNARPEVLGRSTGALTQCVSGTGRPHLSTLTPQLNTVVGDDDGDHVRSKVEVFRSGGAIVWSGQSDFGPPGTSRSVTVPAGVLAEGSSYGWRTTADDGKTSSSEGMNSGTWTSFCEFTVDTVKPAAPYVWSQDYPANGLWGYGAAGQAGNVLISPASQRSGPVARWSFNDGAGAVAADSSGSNRPLTLTGMSWAPGQAAQAVSMTGSGLGTTTGPVFRTDQSYSISAWAKLTDKNQTQVIASADNPSGTFNPFYFEYNKWADRWVLTAPGAATGNPGWSYVQSQNTAQAGVWTHLTATFDAPSRTFKLYVNGNLEGTNTNVTSWQAQTPGSLHIGQAKKAEHFSGSIDELKAWNRTLNADEVAGLMANTGHWAFEETSGATAADASGYGSSLTLTGGYSRTTGPSGSALAFDGTGLGTATGVSIDTAASYTISAWAKLTDKNQTRVIATVDNPGGTFNPFYFEYNKGADRWVMTAPGSGTAGAGFNYVQSANVAQAGVWTHLTATFDAPTRTYRLYVNGKLEGTNNNVTAWQPATPGLLHVGQARSAEHFAGAIDELKVWNRALAPEEIIPPADVAAYTYQLDTDTAPKEYAATGSAWVPVTPSEDGPRTLTVRAKDKAGNLSDPAMYKFNVGRAGLVQPVQGANVVSRAKLQVSADPSYTKVTFQYRRGPGGTILDVPAAHLRTGTGTQVTALPASVAGLGSYAIWNAADTLGTVGGVVQVRARVHTETGTTYDGGWTTINVDPNGDGAASTDIGPGRVNLLTGDYSIDSTDTDELGLKVGRASSSREPADGWVKQGERLTPAQQQVTDLSGLTGGQAGVARVTTRGQASSTDSAELSPAGADSYAALGGDNGALRLAMKPGKRYRATAWIYVPETTGLNPANGRGLRVMGFAKDATGTYREAMSTQAAWTGAWQELTVDLDVPAGATEAFFRLYNGHTTADKKVYFDNLSVREVIAPFGPQWRGGVVDGTAEQEFSSLEFPEAEVVKINAVAGGFLTFARNNAGQFFAAPGAENYSLVKVSDAEYRLKELDGTTTSFTKQGEKFAVSSTWTADSNSTTRYLYDTTDNRSLVKRVINPQEPGTGDCAAATPARGCEVLEYDYATATTAAAGTLGDFTDRVRSVKVWTWDPAAGAVTPVEVTRYRYDEQGRLREVFDPRLASPLKTSYEYDVAGRVTRVTGAGELPWMFDHGKAGTDPSEGRLLKVRRSYLTQGTKDSVEGENTTQVVYNVPLTRGAGGPYDLDHAAISTWAQKDLPTDGTAIFGPESNPGTASATAAVPGADGYRYATVHYLNANGQETNTATPGGDIDSQVYDKHGNVVWSLEAANRAIALGTHPEAARYATELNLPADPAARAALLSTVKAYGTDGVDLVDTLGPRVPMVLENGLTDPTGTNPALPAGTKVLARAHETLSYDENKPDGAAYHLVTTEREGATVDGYPDADTKVTRTGYGAERGGTSGWVLKKSTSTTTEAGTAFTVYDASGRVLTSWGIGSTGSDSRAKQTIYYTAGTGSGDTRCDNRPEWAGQPCVTRSGGPVTGHDPARMSSELPVKFVEEYSRFGEPTRVSESAAGKSRKTVTTFDGADRITKVEITSDEGVAVPALTTEYDASGHVSRTFMGTATIIREYDALGRLVSYTDADGGVTRSEFDRYGKPAKVSDNTGSSTYAYDRAAEPRGLLTSVTDSVAGTFGAKYSPDGKLTELTYPGGITRRDRLDAALNPIERTYTRDSDGTTLYAESVVENSQGHWVDHNYTGGSKKYGYDGVGRLASVQETGTAGQCVTRQYQYDARTNRTGKSTYSAAADGACQTGTASATSSHTYDSADRLTDPGYSYDAFGRTTAAPGGLTNAYYANDLVAAQQTADTRQTWTLDPKHRFRGFTTEKLVNGAWSNATTKLNHYGDDSDEPRWIVDDTTLGKVTRNVSGPDADLVATSSATGDVRLQLANLHGDVALTIDPAGTTPQVLSYDEFGIPAAGQAQQRYGWLGGKQRSAEALGGAILMGVRLYSPETGRFLQVDPVPGGSATDYDYCNADPVNCTDLDGRWGWKKILGKVAKVASIAAVIPGPIGMIASGVAAVSYAATGNWKMAAVMTAGIALSAVGAGAAVMAYRASRIVKAARATQGMSGGIRATRAVSKLAGKKWVQRGATKTVADKGGTRLLSSDKLRQYRSPEYKKKLGTWQSNFESRPTGKGKMVNNYHVTHRKPRKWAPWW
ncbi:LamG-like jellyroll fold domain-containing protein [Longispora albida]|uniref:LamG-like jellyroll fold domain-containing protein n=1 Tax=Longispora albida TaxID=203523 RepID=UPI00037FF52E|nr:LamG-like jellyroll fold domain-containing protein [Longispora albida]